MNNASRADTRKGANDHLLFTEAVAYMNAQFELAEKHRNDEEDDLADACESNAWDAMDDAAYHGDRLAKIINKAHVAALREDRQRAARSFAAGSDADAAEFRAERAELRRTCGDPMWRHAPWRRDR